jgi:hypothetical protein
MSLSTYQYVAPEYGTAQTVHRADFGLRELSKGLLGIMLGYLLAVANGAAAVLLLWYVITHLKGGPNSKAWSDTTTVLYVGLGVLKLSNIFCMWMILRNQWRSLMNAPESGGAKWWMFGAMTCFFAWPVILFLSATFGGISDEPHPQKHETFVASLKEWRAEKYADSMKSRNVVGYTRLALLVIPPLGGLFFVLFLRSVGVYLGNSILARLSEAHLLLAVLLFVETLSLLFAPAQLAFLPHAILVVLGGWLLLFVGYFALILLAIAGISYYLANQRTPLEESAKAAAAAEAAAKAAADEFDELQGFDGFGRIKA